MPEITKSNLQFVSIFIINICTTGHVGKYKYKIQFFGPGFYSAIKLYLRRTLVLMGCNAAFTEAGI